MLIAHDLGRLTTMLMPQAVAPAALANVRLGCFRLCVQRQIPIRPTLERTDIPSKGSSPQNRVLPCCASNPHNLSNSMPIGKRKRGRETPRCILAGVNEAYAVYFFRPDFLAVLFLAAFLAGAFFRATFLAGAFLRAAFLAGALLRAAFLAGALLRAAFLAGAFLRAAFLAGALLRAAFLAGALLRAAFLAGALLRAAFLAGALL